MRTAAPIHTRFATAPCAPDNLTSEAAAAIYNPSMFQPELLLNKRVLITGGGTGLGKATAQRFLELGAEVFICGRREEVVASTAQELHLRTGGRIQARRCDVRDAAAVDEMITAIWAEGPLDVLINNAAGNFLGRTEELSLGGFQSVIGIVLMGSLHATLACGRRWLAANHKGVVLSVTTTYTETGSAYVVPSADAKAGLQALMRSLAVEWGNRGIRMNCIAPGPFPTEGAFSRLLPRPALEEAAKQRIPLGRFGALEEFTNLAAFLVSDGSGYINGDVITIDGGEYLQGAGEFTTLGRQLTEEEWQAMKPKKEELKKK